MQYYLFYQNPKICQHAWTCQILWLFCHNYISTLTPDTAGCLQRAHSFHGGATPPMLKINNLLSADEWTSAC